MTAGSSTIGATDPFEINLLQEADLPAALQLEEKEQWNQTESDWKRLLRLSPHGCFAAFCAGRLIGTLTTITYGQDLAWIGMMLVAQAHRGRGVGKQLMRIALDYCRGSCIETVKLDATPTGRPLYESLGFVPEERIERWQGIVVKEMQQKSGSFGWNDELCPALYGLDRQAFHACRRELLSSLVQDSCVEPALRTAASSRSLQGYALARQGARASYVGPIVAVEPSVANLLLDSLLARLAGTIYLDIRAGCVEIGNALVQRGFVRQRALTRMSLRAQRPTGEPDLVFASAGPELG